MSLTFTLCTIATSFGIAAHGIAALVTSLSPHPPAPIAHHAPRFEQEDEAPPAPARTPREIVAPYTQSPDLAPAARGVAPCSDVVVHAIVASDDPAYSFASFSAAGQKTIARRGARVGDRELTFIGSDRVWLTDKGGRVCRADVYEPPRSAIATAPDAGPARTRGAKPVDPEIARGIKQTGPGAYDIDRATFDRILTSTAELMGDVRVAPDRVNGNVAGLTLSRVRPGSVLTLVGLVEGDRLDSINGIDLTGPEAGLEAYAKLSGAPHIVLKITRAGKQSEITYDVK